MILPILAAGLSAAFGLPARWVALRLGLVSRHGIPLTGGVALLLAWWVISTLFGGLLDDLHLTAGLALALIPILSFGLWDIRTALRPFPQLTAQLLAAVAAVLFGDVAVRFVTNPLGGLLVFDQWVLAGVPLVGAAVSLVWIMVVMNAVNFLDGVDGLAATVSFVGFLAIGAVSLLPQVHEPHVALLAFIAAGATGGLLFWNFPPARLYLGTPGSWFLGFLLAVLSLLGSSKIATLTVVAAMPLLDALVVIAARLRRGASPFRGDSTHFHHILMARGWSPRAVIAAYGIGSALLGLAAVALPTPAKIFLVIISAVAWVSFARRTFRARPSED